MDLTRRVLVAGAMMGVAGVLAWPGGCNVEAFINNTASLGGDTPGGRGHVQVLFINDTPYRAIFTFGSYDPQDQNSTDQNSTDQNSNLHYEQYNVDSTAVATTFNRGLAGNNSTDVLTFSCGRAFVLGEADFIQRIRDNKAIRLSGASEPTSEAAFTPGIAFSDKDITDPDAETATAGFAEPVTTLQGVQFQCESLLTYTFRGPDATGKVTVELVVTLP